MPLNDVVTQEPLAGVEGTLCRKRDVECTAPVSTPTLSDASGNLALKVPANFDGYVMLRSATTAPFLYFFNPMINHDVTLASVPLTNPVVFSLLVSQLTGAKPTEESGAILLTAIDCKHAFAEGVTFEASMSGPHAVGFYSVEGLPNGQVSATDAQAYGGFVNVSPGSVTVTGKVAANQREITTISLIVRAGFISYSQVGPDGP